MDDDSGSRVGKKKLPKGRKIGDSPSVKGQEEGKQVLKNDAAKRTQRGDV